MDHREWKKALNTIYQPPDPRGKGAFLARLDPPRLSIPEFVLIQAAYLRPWSWLLSAGIFAAALLLMWGRPTGEICLVSALLPFAALSTVTELHRSARYRMEELEAAARFSLKALLLARLTLLGLGNLLLLAALLPVVMDWSRLTLAETGFYLLCPYCLTSLLSLILVRRRRSGEPLYLCAGAAAAVSLLCLLWQQPPRFLMEAGPTGYVGATLVLAALMVWEYKQYLFRGEESIWN